MKKITFLILSLISINLLAETIPLELEDYTSEELTQNDLLIIQNDDEINKKMLEVIQPPPPSPTQDTYYPKEITQPEDTTLDQDHVLIPETKALVIAANKDDLYYVDDAEGLEVIGIKIPGKFDDFQKRINPLFLHRDLTKNNIKEIKLAIINYFQQHNMPLISVNVPEQDVTNGVLSLILTEGRLGEIYTVCNKWTNSKTIVNYFSLKPCECIDEHALRNDLSFINKNPFRKVDLIYSPGEEPSTTDIELLVSDRFPFRPYTGTDNTGLIPTGRNRWFAGFNWNNFLFIDSILSYQYTASYNIPSFQAHTGHYVIYLPWKHLFTVFGGYSIADVNHIVPTTSRNKATSAQISGRYDIYLPWNDQVTYDLLVGFDFKRTNNDLDFSEHDFVTTNAVNLTQFLFGLVANYEKKGFKSNLNVEVYWSPGSLVKDESNTRYHNLRNFSRNAYVYSRIHWSNLWQLPKNMLFSFDVTGQLTNENLLPSETLGIGGYDSVRGYYERELNADNGLIINTELRSPGIPLFERLKKRRLAKDGLQLIGFFDYGLSGIHKTVPGEKTTRYIMGFGPGLRYVMDPYISIRVDWGFKAKHNPLYRGGSSLFHFAVNLSY